MKKKITVNKHNVSRKTFWCYVKDLHVIKRLYRAKYGRMGYCMPYGGMEDSNDYTIADILLSFNHK